MSYTEAIRYLFSLGNEVRSARLGLDRIRKVLNRLGNPQDSFRSVHVAGTNGKGSTAAMIEAGLRAAGHRTGLYTSPHLVRINERVQVCGCEISDEDFCASFQTVHDAVEKLLADGELDAHPTYFECVTAIAFHHFRTACVEWAAVEVGLGGRLDATNVLRPAVAVLTPIDYDHEVFLGKPVAAIAAEKAGILKPGVPAVWAPQRAEVREVLERYALDGGIRVVRVGEDWRAEDVGQQDGCYRFHATHRSGRRLNLELPLAGEHQVTNALAAGAALDLLGAPDRAIERGLAQTRWPGRLELIAGSPAVLLDGAHNPAGARALAAFAEKHFAGKRIWLIFAAMRDKAVEEVAGILFPIAHRVIVTRVAQSRAVSPETLYAIVAHHHPHVEIGSSLAESLARARAAAAPTDIILVTGSLFLVGEAKALNIG